MVCALLFIVTMIVINNSNNDEDDDDGDILTSSLYQLGLAVENAFQLRHVIDHPISFGSSFKNSKILFSISGK